MSQEENQKPQIVQESPSEYSTRETSPKTDQITLEKCRLDYISSNWKSIKELSDRYSIHPTTLNQRIIREEWEKERQINLKELERKVVKKSISLGEEYLARAYKRAEKYEAIIDASMDNFGSKDKFGTPLLDPDAITSFTQAELRIHELAKSALRIPDVKNLDITSKGKSLGENLVEAIERLRENDKSPALSDKEIERIVEAEVIEEDSKNV